MYKSRYRIAQVETGLYDLFEDGMFLARFSRPSFREDLQSLGRGNGWIGSILRLLNRAYPALAAARSLAENGTPADDILQHLGERGIVEYLRNKGYTVYKPVSISDETLINYLMTKGYEVEAKGLHQVPLTSKTPADSNCYESAHSGSRSLCAVGEM